MKESSNLEAKKVWLTRGTKCLLDLMFYSGILVTLSVPWSVKWLGQYLPGLVEHYGAVVLLYLVLGVLALMLIRELRTIFRTVLAQNCFVEGNVISLRRMGSWSFLIAGISVVRSIVYLTPTMLVVILVFLIAGLFSKVLALVFEEAVRYKEENDLTV